MPASSGSLAVSIDRGGSVRDARNPDYEAVYQTTDEGLGQSSASALAAIRSMGSISSTVWRGSSRSGDRGGADGGRDRRQRRVMAAEYIRGHMTKPVAAYIAGVTAPAGKRMGHAGAIVTGGTGTAEDKYAGAAGSRDCDSPLAG